MRKAIAPRPLSAVTEQVRLGQKKLSELTAAEMRQALGDLRPNDKLYAGIQFLNLVLDRDGANGVLEFGRKAGKILDKEGKLLAYDFNGYETLLEQAKPNALNRRTFMQTMAWGITGAVFGAWGAFRTADQVSAYCTGESQSQLPAEAHKTNGVRAIFTKGQKLIDDHLMGPAEALIGIALVHENIVKWEEIKLEEISNAAAEFAELMRIRQPRKALAAGPKPSEFIEI